VRESGGDLLISRKLPGGTEESHETTIGELFEMRNGDPRLLALPMELEAVGICI